jgi:hypothetical protein
VKRRVDDDRVAAHGLEYGRGLLSV